MLSNQRAWSLLLMAANVFMLLAVLAAAGTIRAETFNAASQSNAARTLYAMNTLPGAGAGPAAFGRFFDNGSRAPWLPPPSETKAPITLPEDIDVKPVARPAARIPFVVEIPQTPAPPFLRTFRRLAAQDKTKGYDNLIYSYSIRHGLDPRLVKAVIAAESEFTPTAKSPAGALGLMQVMPTTAGALGTSKKALFDPEANIRTGTAYLAHLFARAWKRYNLRGVSFTKAPQWLVQRVIAAYNAGPRFLAHRRLYRQTRDYIKNVLLFYRSTVSELKPFSL